MLESKVSVPTEWSIWNGRIWGGVFEVLGTRDEKLLESSEKGSIRIRSGLVKLWEVDGIEKKCICLRNTTWQDT